MTPRRKSRESGFALLLVFAMAAIVALMIYLELPRVAFEAQRAKEELLIERGEQYRRAIQLYMRKTGRYPPNIDALENTNNTRFLRRRYKDPMTGKDEWRLIHVGPGGVFTDSLTMKPDATKQGAAGPLGAQTGGQTGGQFGTSIGQSIGTSMGTAVGSSTTSSSGSADAGAGAPPVPSLVPPRRPSDMRRFPGGLPMPGADTGDQQQPQPQDQAAQYPPAAPGQPGAQPPTGQQPQPGQAPLPGQVVPGQVLPGQALPGQQPQQPQMGYQMGQPIQNIAENPPQVPAQSPAAQAAAFGAAAQPAAPTGQVQPIYSGQQIQPGVNVNPGLTTAPQAGPQGSPGALQAIENALRNPRQQPGFGGGGALTVGGGIAGVATTLEATGIKIYGDRTKYNEWEFIYDPRKDPRLGGMGAVGPVPGLQPGPSTGSNTSTSSTTSTNTSATKP